MAFVQEFDDEEQGGQQGQQGQGGPTTSQGSGTITGGNSKGDAQAPASGAGKTTRTGWSNLQSYLSANKGNDAALGQRISGKIGEQAQGVEQAKSAITPAAQQDAQKNTVTDQGVIKALQTDPTKVDKKTFQAQSSATYQGPEDVSAYDDYAKGQQSAKTLQEKLALTGSESGQKSLIRDVAGPNYTQGLGNLDQFILSAGEQGKKAITDTQQQYGNVAGGWQSLVDSLNDRLKTAKQTTEDTAAQTRQAYEDAYGKTKGSIQSVADTVAGINTTRKQEATNLQSQFASTDPKVQADLAKRLGISTGDLYYMRDILKFTPQEIINYSGDLSLGDVVNQQDKARYEALLGLADRASEFSFAGSGKGQQGAQVKTDIVKAAAEAKAIRDDVNRRRREENDKRLKLREQIKSDFTAGYYSPLVAEATGLTKREFDIARRGNYLGEAINLNFQPGRDLTDADIATADQRKNWQNLMKVLGSRDKSLNLGTAAPSGAPSLLDFDANAVRQAIARGDARAAESAAAQAKAAEEARRIREDRAIAKGTLLPRDEDPNLAVRF